MNDRKPFVWGLVATTFFIAALVWACSGAGGDADDPGAEATEVQGAALIDPFAVDAAAPTPATLPTEKNLKVAFIGDTGTGADFRSVLQPASSGRTSFAITRSP